MKVIDTQAYDVVIMGRPWTKSFSPCSKEATTFLGRLVFRTCCVQYPSVTHVVAQSQTNQSSPGFAPRTTAVLLRTYLPFFTRDNSGTWVCVCRNVLLMPLHASPPFTRAFACMRPAAESIL